MTVVERFRWWHIEEVVPIEEDLFGAERWTAAMFWNELAQRHFYLVATDQPGGPALGYAGLSVVDEHESWVQNIAVRRDAQRRGIGRLLLEALLAEAARRGARKTLLGYEIHQAFHQRYVEEMRRRMMALIDAYFATGPAPLQRLRSEFGVTHLIVNRDHYQGTPLTYFLPFDDQIANAFRIANGQPETLRQAATASVFELGRAFILDLDRFAAPAATSVNAPRG